MWNLPSASDPSPEGVVGSATIRKLIWRVCTAPCTFYMLFYFIGKVFFVFVFLLCAVFIKNLSSRSWATQMHSLKMNVKVFVILLWYAYFCCDSFHLCVNRSKSQSVWLHNVNNALLLHHVVLTSVPLLLKAPEVKNNCIRGNAENDVFRLATPLCTLSYFSS